MSGPELYARVASSVEPTGGICPTWLNTDHILFQIANLFLLFSYLLQGGLYTLLQMRVVLDLGSSFFAILGYIILCAFDTLVWKALFTLIDLVRFCVLATTRNGNLSLLVSINLLLIEIWRPVQQVGKCEFLESPEWFVVPKSDLYQVTATPLGA
ncbi:hypothetical protein IscW_ISCW012842 [Ixodes scapularis]|uniref:POPDC1-3 domain-containing protein n=1 Tax=Ixodes scapularis TaxID=6945 RepID=B7QFV7_IXOSC|nr:hypothetical protein IscW_ISCW012842 [Ixodes scapularis]|eukprot:XP_002400985.1 hypothetical protein IscW_ISCW012842 [Ixodes scapularis]